MSSDQLDKSATNTSTRTRVDWSLVKREYEVSGFSIREIARRFGTSDMSVRRKIKRFSWRREEAAGRNQEPIAHR